VVNDDPRRENQVTRNGEKSTFPSNQPKRRKTRPASTTGEGRNLGKVSVLQRLKKKKGSNGGVGDLVCVKRRKKKQQTDRESPASTSRRENGCF